MTRYSKLIGFIFFAIITLGTYGITQVIAESNRPKAETTTIEGDDSYLTPIHFKGSIYGNSFLSSSYLSSSSFEFIDNHFIFPENQSLSEKLDDGYNATYNRLMSEHRSFLRGKSPYGTYAETDDQVIYVSMKRDMDFSDHRNNSTVVSVLNKATEEETAYTLSPPEELGDIVILEDTYVSYPDIYFTFSAADQLSVYSLSLEERTPAFTKIRELYQELGTDITSYQGYDSSIDIRYLELYDATQNNSVMTTSHLYDYESNQITSIPSSVDLVEPKVVTDDDQIYMLDVYLENYQIYKVDSVNDTLEPLTKMQLVPYEEDDSSDYVQITPYSIVDGALYSVLSTNNQELIQVNDIQTGELLYGGSVETTGKYENQTKASIYDFNIIE